MQLGIIEDVAADRARSAQFVRFVLDRQGICRAEFPMSAADAILVIRLGAMGDIIHALPAVASLKKSFPQRKLMWLVAPRWLPLLEGNPSIDELIPVERSSIISLGGSWRRLRTLRPGLAVDFQGLVKSAFLGRISGPKEFLGFARSIAREPLASFSYTRRIKKALDSVDPGDDGSPSTLILPAVPSTVEKLTNR